jgi:type II secretory pathway component GspD/PulD (secretin)
VEFRTLDPVLIPNTNSFIVQLTTDQKDMFDEYIALIDRNDQATPVTLKYIQADELLKKLPPSIPKEKIIETPNPSLVFIKGTDATLKAFYKELEILDRPVPQVRYQLLVIQYQDGNSLSVNKDTKNITLGETTSMSFAGNIDSLFKVNFDIPSTLGWGFALELNASLNDKRAQIMADTTLVGISGQDVSFQNTETQRFRETTADNNNDDNDDSTSIIREIQTGLNFGVHGVASGDGMITMKVTADLTQGGSASGGDLPSTSTNKITTHVRALSGEVVQVGGLIRQDHSDEVNKIPLLGDIPLLGLLFQHKNETIQNSEVVIYVLPRVESQFNEEIELGIQLERLYNKFLYNSD